MRLLALLRRIWKRLHPFTWLVMLVVFAALIIIVVPGEKYAFWQGDLTQKVPQNLRTTLHLTYEDNYYQHGWPLIAAVRVDHQPKLAFPVVNPRRTAIPYWCEGESWSLVADAWAVDWSRVAIDIAVAMLILLATGAATEFWIRRRGGLWRFRVADLLAVLTIGALMLGWYQYHRLVQEQERQEIDQASNLDHQSFGTAGLTYCGPEWLRRLLGGSELISVCNHFREAQVNTLNCRSWQCNVAHLENLPYVERVVLRPWLPRGALDTLAEMPRLQSLQLGAFFEHRPLEEAFAKQGGLVRPWQLDELRCLRLQQLSIASDDILAEDVERVCRALPSLQRLELENPSLTQDELKQLTEQFSAIEFEVSWTSRDRCGLCTEPTENHAAYVEKAKWRRATQLQELSVEPGDNTHSINR